MIFDVIIIGGGIAGCSLAYFLKDKCRVAIVDKNGIASGGSGAAGAFLSPMVGKNSPFKQFVNESLKFSFDFYEKHFSHLLTKNGVLRVPKDFLDKEMFCEYAKYNNFEALNTPQNNFLTDEILNLGGFYFSEGGIIKSKELCMELSKGCDIYTLFVNEIKKSGDFFEIGNLKAKKIIMSQGGADELLIENSYIKIRAIWGQRVTIKTNLNVSFNIHQNISISNSVDGNIAIGATHERLIKDAQIERAKSLKLIDEAKSIIKLDEYEIVSESAGCRAGSEDYFPIIGKLIDYEKTVDKFPQIKNGLKIEPKKCIFHEDVYIFNGVGARGFVMSPYLGNLLANNILYDTELDKNLTPYRMFIRYARKK